MAAGRQKGRRRQPQQEYIYDNVARELDVPEYDGYGRRRKSARIRPVPGYHYEKRKAVLGLRYTIFLILSIVALIGCCYMYIKANSNLNAARSQVSSMRSELAMEQEKTSGMEEELNKNVDLEEIYEKAVGELGMQYPEENQIIYYDSSSDYIRQAEDIPGSD